MNETITNEKIRLKSKKDLIEFLKADCEALKITRKHPRLLGDEIWKFEIILRKHEYWQNVRHDFLGKLICKYYKIKHHYLGIKLGFEIPVNCFGKGLRINHFGSIIVNYNAYIGDNCNIHQGVVIGQNIGDSASPHIADNCFLGTGCKIIGNIKIGNNVFIGANAIVNKNFTEDNVVLAGVPAKIVKIIKN